MAWSIRERDKSIEEHNEEAEQFEKYAIKPLGDALNLYNTITEGIDKAVVPQRRRTIDAASEFVGEQTDSKVAEVGTAVAGEFLPDSVDIALASATIFSGGTLAPLTGSVYAGKKLLDITSTVSKAKRTIKAFDTATDVKKTLNPIFEGTSLFSNPVSKNVDLSILKAPSIPKPVRTIDFQAIDSKKRRDAIGRYFDEMYTEGMTEAQKYTYLEAANFGGQATEKGQKFVKSVAGTHRNIFGGSAHHFGLDLGLSGATLNRSDAPEILKILNSVDVFPGNHPKNYIMAYHDYTKQIVDRQKAALIQSGMKAKDADKFLKKIPEGKMLGKAELADLNTWETLDELEKLKKIQGRNWKATGVDPKDIDLPKALIGTDHQEFIHGIGDKLPKRLALIELAKTDKWLDLSPQQAAQKIAEVVREQQNVALNVNKWRLDKIKKAMKFDPAKQDWTDIQAWMIQDPRRAAHLDWHKTGAEGIGMSIEKITSDLPPNVAKEVAQVFNLEHVPKTNAKLRAFLSKTGLEQKLK